MTSFSYSQLSTALSCQQLYTYLYIDKLKVEEKESLALHFGTALHSALNALLEGSDGNAAFTAYWDSVANMDFESGRHNHANLSDMGHIFIDRFQKLHLKNYKLLHGETRLFGSSPTGIQLEGTPDAIAEYKGKLSLIDFKTSSSRYQDGRVEASDQLRLYAYLAQQHYGIKIEQLVYVVFIKQKEPSIQVLVQDLNQDELIIRIFNIEVQCSQLQAALKMQVAKNHNACFNYGRRCQYFNLCHPENKVDTDNKGE